MLSSRVKDQQRKYLRARIECPIKLRFEDGRCYDIVTEQISYMGLELFCNHEKAMTLFPEGISRLSRANPQDCSVEIENDGHTVDLAAQIESVCRLSQDKYKVMIAFDDQTSNFESYQRYKKIMDIYIN